MNVRLEYAEKNGKFIITALINGKNHTSCFETICQEMEVERANRFITEMKMRYPQLTTKHPFPIPSMKEIKSELFQFIKRDIQMLEQEMDKAYKRRSKLFNKEI